MERVHDARRHAEHAVKLAQGWSPEELGNDETRLRAIIFDLTVIGTAFGKISGALKGLDPNLPWVRIIDTRNRFVHAYWQIDVIFVTKLIETDLRELIVSLDRLIAVLERDEP